MAKRLTKKEKAFAKEYINTGVATTAALEAYDTTDYHTAGVIGHENLKKPKVLAYIESKAGRASERVVELSEQEDNLPVALGASKDILDRAGFKPTEKSLNLNLAVEVETSDRIKELAAVLNAAYKNGLSDKRIEEDLRPSLAGKE